MLALGISVALLVAATLWLLVRGAERNQELDRYKNAEHDARREAGAASKRAEEAAARSDKLTAELAKVNNQVKELKQQVNDAKEQAKQTKKAQKVEKEPENVDRAAEKVALRRANARIEELEGELSHLRDQTIQLKEALQEAMDVAAKKPEVVEVVVQKAVESGSTITEDDVRRAVADARRSARKEAQEEARGKVEADVARQAERIEKLKRAIVEREVELRRLRKRFGDAELAFVTTQGQLEMAHDRICFLETGKHRRPHRKAAMVAAELPVNITEHGELSEVAPAQLEQWRQEAEAQLEAEEQRAQVAAETAEAKEMARAAKAKLAKVAQGTKGDKRASGGDGKRPPKPTESTEAVVDSPKSTADAEIEPTTNAVPPEGLPTPDITLPEPTPASLEVENVSAAVDVVEVIAAPMTPEEPVVEQPAIVAEPEPAVVELPPTPVVEIPPPAPPESLPSPTVEMPPSPPAVAEGEKPAGGLSIEDEAAARREALRRKLFGMGAGAKEE
ncbi:MAG: hypothetical protein HUU55_04150 [Myxococcales bacterium]|nr:hypothetical protein [Myxococcales bacterium]